MEIAKQGATLIIEREILNEFGGAADLSGATAYLGQKLLGDSTITETQCTITGNTVSVQLDTSVLGMHEFHIRLWLDGQTLDVESDRLLVEDGILNEMPT